MAKRKRAGAQVKSSEWHEEDFDPNASKLKINSYEDIPDSEDEFYINRDKILLDNGPNAKRRKPLQQQQDEFLELSDEEVLGLSDNASDDEIAEEDTEEETEAAVVNVREEADDAGYLQASDDEIDGWGTSRRDYYNTDAIETEQDALDEEAEARRLQQKRLKGLTEADFGFDEKYWFGSSNADQPDANGGVNVYTEILPQLQVTDDMGLEQRLELLNIRYPEFEPLAKELVVLQPLYDELSHAAKDASGESISGGQVSMAVLKLQALSAYLGSLAMYFAILTSPADKSQVPTQPMAPHDLREHDIMETLVKCRELWSRVKDMGFSSPSSDISDGQSSDFEVSEDSDTPITEPSENEALSTSAETSKEKTLDPEVAASLARRAERLRKTEDSLAVMSSLVSKRSRTWNSTKTARIAPSELDGHSDIGDEVALAPGEAAEKARRRKSLRFYTSQIAQKANKRAFARRSAGGDDDLPYRERFRDRQQRLLKEIEVKGSSKSDSIDRDFNTKKGAELENGNFQRTKDVEVEAPYVTALEGRVRAKKEQRRLREDAYRQAAAEGGRVVRHEAVSVGPDGRREIGYAIEKNKGMTPRRKKENRNPRVKKRIRYEDKKKKLNSMKPVFRGGEGRGGYGGELTGIKTGLVRSVKL